MKFNYYLFANDVFRLILKKIRLFAFSIWETLHHPKISPSDDTEIDIVITVVEKDISILPICIEGVKKNICHPIKNIYLVAPDNKLIKDFAAENNLQFVSEVSIFGYASNQIGYSIFSGLNRSGWIFQQLIKLSGKVGNCRYFVAIDADHVLLKPHVFLSKGKTVFYQSFDNNIPYYNNIKRLMGFFPIHWFSYVSHKMLFDKEVLTKLHASIEKRNGCSWDQAIIKNLKTTEHSDFSEFELYGHFLPHTQKLHVPWKEKALHIEKLASLNELKRKYPEKMSVSFSSYLHTLPIKQENRWERYFNIKENRG
jgi:hypothetical protein